MAEQDDPLAGTEFAGGNFPGAAKPAPAQVGDGDDPLAGTEFARPTSGNVPKVAGAPATTPAATPVGAPVVAAGKPEFLKTNRPEPEETSFSDVISAWPKTVGPSAKAFGESLIEPFTHPKETAQAIGQLGTGIYSKARGALGYDQNAEDKVKDEAALDQMGRYFQERYGSKEAAMRTMKEDPVAFFADISVPFTGGGSLAARLPGAVGTIGKAATTVGRAIDPLSVAMKAPQVATKAISSAINVPAALQSGSAFKSLQAAHEAGVTKNPTFLEHYSGQASAPELIEKVKSGVQKVADERSANYLAGMDPLKARTGLDYTPINDVIQNARGSTSQGIGAFHGTTINAQAQDVLSKVENLVKEFQSKPPGDPHHTLQGFDQLKQGIGNLRYEARGNAQAERVINEAYNAVKQSIVNVDPKYAKLMDQYGEASQKLNDMHKTLLGGGSTDTRINKILKSYKTGDKGNLLQDLAGRDPNLMYAIAGHDLKPWFPGGLRGTLTSVGLGGLSYAGFGALSPAHLLHGALISPKISGGLSYGLGRAGALPERTYRATQPAVEAARQAGRAEEVLPPPAQARGGRISRATGGRAGGVTTADMLIAAAERAKKNDGKVTESLLAQPDEAITRALAIANKHI